MACDQARQCPNPSRSDLWVSDLSTVLRSTRHLIRLDQPLGGVERGRNSQDPCSEGGLASVFSPSGTHQLSLPYKDCGSSPSSPSLRPYPGSASASPTGPPQPPPRAPVPSLPFQSTLHTSYRERSFYRTYLCRSCSESCTGWLPST